MTEHSAERDPEKQRPPSHVIAYYSSVAILIVGFVTAGLVYVFAADDDDVDAAAEIASQRMYQHNLEVIGGKFAVYLDDFNRWFASLWHGKALAYTIGVLTIAIAIVCFWVGEMIAKQLQDGSHDL